MPVQSKCLRMQIIVHIDCDLKRKKRKFKLSQNKHKLNCKIIWNRGMVWCSTMLEFQVIQSKSWNYDDDRARAPLCLLLDSDVIVY